jgi:putative ABC transport system substrate-binding protein
MFPPRCQRDKVDRQGRLMRRRDFMALLGGGAALWPRGVGAQQAGKVYRIGIFVSVNPVMAPAYDAFVDELRVLGFIEGPNFTIDRRRTDQSPAALANDVAEMVHSKVDAIFIGVQPALQAAAATGIPTIIAAVNFDPIAHGYVQSLARPGGNITGVVLRQTELAEKQVELLTQAFPERKRLAVLWDSISGDQFSAAERRAKALGLEIISLNFERLPYDFAAAFQTMADRGAQMLLTLSSPFFGSHIQSIADLTIRYRLPTMFIFRRYVELGGLMSYGTDNTAMFRQAAAYVAKVLRGAKPADLPVEQPNKFEFVVNLKTAKAIGVELPTSSLLRADEVIE